MSNHFALSGGGVYSAEHGQVLDSQAMRVAEILHDYNEYFELQFIPANAQDDTAAPYRVVDNTPGVARNVVCYVTQREMQNPQALLANIWRGDLRFHSVDSIMTELELEETAKKLLELKQKEERASEDEDMMAHYLGGGRDGRHYMRHHGHLIAR